MTTISWKLVGPELTYTPMEINHSKCCFYLAESADTLIGFYGLEQLSSMQMELIVLFVAPPLISQGDGCVLIDYVRAQARSKGAKEVGISSKAGSPLASYSLSQRYTVDSRRPVRFASSKRVVA